ncbi:MAG: UDP-N-acetylglucosamine--N-acetylmuramyl-(pentapeptide) pyrophosphoryl-undecaprenol N-acetylglucosamine transferase [Verrucomicrobiales bacterium]|jgi:UDP-N-acetylglucosamine--N-acetylmuramyl-(pentapeptide) pyrophosphoryl-undecaprenol N-acetylglucosamine transferase
MTSKMALKKKIASNGAKKGVIIACGGTGGHLFPGIAIAEQLISRGRKVILLISEKEIDQIASQAYPHLRFEQLPSVAAPKPWSPKMFPFLSKLRKGVKRTKQLIKEIDADTVIGMGGFTSTAPLLAAKMAGCVGMIHEANAIPGRANRLNARIARFALCGWEACKKHLPSKKAKVVGTPVRSGLYKLPEPAAARQHFGLEKDRFTLMVMGGSQGAHGINEAVVEMLQFFEPELIQMLHITGQEDFKEVSAGYAKTEIRSHVVPFTSEIEQAYAACDLAVCRSGASSLTEMSVIGLPGILVPYPHATDDHQNRNADVFVEKDACVVIQQKDLTAEVLARTIAELGTNSDRLKTMGENMKTLAPKHAARAIRQLVEMTAPA